jgi:hypothetical protein
MRPPEEVLNQTPRERLTDARGQPYFVWDQSMTLSEFEAGLVDPDPEVRVRVLARLMRDARPDDVFLFVTPEEIVAVWDSLEPLLGRQRAFWRWLMEEWGELPRRPRAG